ncbi:muconolactone Delta-isomerase [Futiania mangrovi]|uniref:muconolactone Delta-isomerase n=1 Tax=Futiania mangrovi TaxID=2959716 RepID=A0A9J6PCR7_9PROT|nr:muconolactone Delta-isomerase family protein [Futiania mangrovii]MCP1337141.1 muconolactone Delta-isomerase family protein [Futiania mangrovii]
MQEQQENKAVAEFLVNIKFVWPESVSDETRAELRDRERAYAAELVKKGHLVRMWRVPGRKENWGLWRAKDATELHDVLTSLPVWPYMDLQVHAVAKHPVDPLRHEDL